MVDSYIEANGTSFYGPAPLHHTLLSGSRRTGVTVQTLHPKHFDNGRILAQTPQPGWEHGCHTVEALSSQLGQQGADMLVACIKNRLYLYGSSQSDDSPQAMELEDPTRENDTLRPRHAPKITKKDGLIAWTTMTAAEILQRHEIIGPLWNTVGARRLIWSGGFELALQIPASELPVGQPVVRGLDQCVYIRTCDDQVLRVHEIKFEGDVQYEPLKAATKAGMHDPQVGGDGPLFQFPISSEMPS